MAAAAREVDVEQDDIGEALVDELDGGVHLVRLADDLDGVAELGPHAGPEDRMVLDEEDPRAADLDCGAFVMTGTSSWGTGVTVGWRMWRGWAS